MPIHIVQYLLFHKALAVAGGASELAVILNVSPNDLEIWVTAKKLAPTHVLEATLALVQPADKLLPRRGNDNWISISAGRK